MIAAIFETGSPDSVIANNVVWLTETVNHEVSMGVSVLNSAATATRWQGVGAVASEVTATGLNAGLQTLADWTADMIAITQAAVDAFMLARSSVIPSLMSQTNRDEWGVLNSTNFFGQNTPAIVDRDTEYYGEHWPHNCSVGWTYSGALSALAAALAVPPPVSPTGASPATSVEAGEAVAQAAAEAGMNNGIRVSTEAAQKARQAVSPSVGVSGQFGSLIAQPLQLISHATEPLSQLLQAPAKAAQSIEGLPRSMMQAMSGMFPSAALPNIAAAEVVAEPVEARGGTVSEGLGGVVGFPGAGLTSYTRPASSFEQGGRPTGLCAGVLDAAEVRGPIVSSGMGAAPMSLTPAGMLARRNPAVDDQETTMRARVVLDGVPRGLR